MPGLLPPRVQTLPNQAATHGAAIPHNLAIKFVDDSIDETNVLAKMLERDSAVAAMLNLTVRTLSGDHLRPIKQEVTHSLTSAIARHMCS